MLVQSEDGKEFILKHCCVWTKLTQFSATSVLLKLHLSVSLLYLFWIGSTVCSTIYSVLWLNSILLPSPIRKTARTQACLMLCHDWIIFFGYAGQLKTFCPLFRQRRVFVYARLCALFPALLESCGKKKLFWRANLCKTTTPGDGTCEGTCGPLRNRWERSPSGAGSHFLHQM